MSKDKIVAEIENDEVTNITKLAPLFIQNYKNFDTWIRSRSIDIHRTNSRLLRKILRLQTSDERKLVFYANASTITDTYWIKEKDSNLTYKDILFKRNPFADLALYGDINAFDLEPTPTPELTNIGSYEKCWKFKRGQWYMYKKGTEQELFSEMFAYKLGTLLKFNMAKYHIDKPYVISKDFTYGANVNFEPMYSIVLDNEDYIDNIEALDDKLIQDYLNMIFLDTILMNVDRHTFNYGVFRDTEKGDIISLAPNFDNNLSLISRGYSKSTERNDLMVKLFLEIKDKVNYTPPILTKDMLYIIANEMNKEFDNKFNVQYIVDFCYNAYKKLV